LNRIKIWELIVNTRDDLLELRADMAVVVGRLLVKRGAKHDEARKMVKAMLPPPPGHERIEPSETAQAEILREGLHDLRRVLAVVMANLLTATGRTREEVEEIVFDSLRPKRRDKGN
jgi:hypothetical protein